MRRKLSRAFGIVWTLLLLLSTLQATKIDAQAFDNSSREGVVAVVMYLKNVTVSRTYDWWDYQRVGTYSELEYSGGSGFFVGEKGENPSYIVTAAHVVEDYYNSGEGAAISMVVGIYIDEEGYYYALCLDADSAELRIYYGDNDYDIAYVDCIGSSEKVDLAVLRLRNATGKRRSLPVKKADDSMVGSTVYTIGFPGSSDNMLTGASHYGLEDATVKNGIISKLAVESGVGVERIQTNAQVAHGDSGGPMVTDDGYVIGVNTNKVTTQNGELDVETDYYAVSGGELIRFLDKNNIPYSTDGDPVPTKGSDNGDDGDDVEKPKPKEKEPEPKGGMSTGLLIAIIAGAVVVVGGIVALIIGLVSSGKKKEQAAQQQAQLQMAQVQANAQAQVAQAQAQAQQAQAQAQAAAARANAQPQKKPMMRSMSAQHNGMTIALSSAPVMIGRDPATCKLVYKEGTAGVSGRHCQIAFDQASGDFLITDLRSTYGTFLMNGQKLNANVPYHLKSGESFYVGDPANVIKVELG
ncbi:MAG: trypsin-like peptidase domain-containing protein [Lachnospiraceae bacterium]|nr:trypsin-like peptidase domain-containing protein [Lachnospiraceae bacterium]